MRSTLALVGMVSLVACGGGNAPAPAAPSRVDAVQVNQGTQERDLDAFCEVRPKGAEAPAFALPELDAPEAPRAGWTWYALWATWCVPCIEEMPLMQDWDSKLEAAGAPVDLRFVSVDASLADLDRFKASRPTLPPTVRVKKQESVAPWLTTLGLDAAASIPIHVFVDPQGKVRCVRVGSVSAPDYNTVRYLLTH